MKHFTIHNKQIAVPSHWSDITLGEYEQWAVHKCIASADERRACMAKICKLTAEEWAEMPTPQLQEIEAHLQFVFQDYNAQSATAKVDDATFAIVAKDDLTVGEWLQLEEINKNDNPLYSDILAVVCRPIGEVFDEQNLSQRAHLFRGQKCDVIFPVINFFLHHEGQSLELLKLMLQTIADSKEFLDVLKEFQSEGDGIKRLSYPQRKRYAYLVKSLQKELSALS